MGEFYWHILSQALADAPGIISSNWAAVLLSITIFTIYFFIRSRQEESYRHGKSWREKLAAMQEHWKRNARDGVIVTAVAWVILFSISFVKTIYTKHQEEVSDNQILKGALSKFQQAEQKSLPSFTGTIDQVVVGGADSKQFKNGTMLILIVSLRNTGQVPSVAENWQLTITKPGERDSIATMSVGITKGIVIRYRDGKVERFGKRDSLFEKTFQEPIGVGAAKRGIAQFFVPGIVLDPAHIVGLKLNLVFSDTLGHGHLMETEANKAITESLYFPGLT